MYKFFVTRRAKLYTWICYFMLFNKHDRCGYVVSAIYQLFTSRIHKNHRKVLIVYSVEYIVFCLFHISLINKHVFFLNGTRFVELSTGGINPQGSSWSCGDRWIWLWLDVFGLGFCIFWQMPSWCSLFFLLQKVANPYPFKQARSNYKLLGGGFKKCLCSPLFGEDSHFDQYFWPTITR